MTRKLGRRRARDGWKLLTSSERRARRKHTGQSARGQKRAIKTNRRYKKGWL